MLQAVGDGQINHDSEEAIGQLIPLQNICSASRNKGPTLDSIRTRCYQC